MKYFSYIIVLLCIVIVSSCGPKIVYEEQFDFGDTWEYNETAVFQFEIENSNKEYDLLLTVVHDKNFSHQNFYTNITTKFPTGEEFTDPLSIELANKMGSWLSDCNDNVCLLHLLLRDDIKFKDIGKYDISFIQNTREANLKGIKSIKLSLIETKE